MQRSSAGRWRRRCRPALERLPRPRSQPRPRARINLDGEQPPLCACELDGLDCVRDFGNWADLDTTIRFGQRPLPAIQTQDSIATRRITCPGPIYTIQSSPLKPNLFNGPTYVTINTNAGAEAEPTNPRCRRPDRRRQRRRCLPSKAPSAAFTMPKISTCSTTCWIHSPPPTRLAGNLTQGGASEAPDQGDELPLAAAAAAFRAP